MLDIGVRDRGQNKYLSLGNNVPIAHFQYC